MALCQISVKYRREVKTKKVYTVVSVFLGVDAKDFLIFMFFYLGV